MGLFAPTRLNYIRKKDLFPFYFGRSRILFEGIGNLRERLGHGLVVYKSMP